VDGLTDQDIGAVVVVERFEPRRKVHRRTMVRNGSKVLLKGSTVDVCSPRVS
jgi:hypothetical protein